MTRKNLTAFSKKDHLIISKHKHLLKLFGNSFPVHFIVNPEGVVTDYLVGGANNTTKHLEIEDAVNRQLQGK